MNHERCAVAIRLAKHFCLSGPTCLLTARASAPRLIFVGVIGRLEKNDCRGGRSGRLNAGPASGLRSRDRSVSSATVRCRRPFLPWALPPAGLSATPIDPAGPLVVRARVRARPRIASPASGERLSRSPIRSWALRRPSRLKNHFDGCRRTDFPPAGLLVVPALVRLPFSVLWG